jgi:hypothetical protein
MIPWAFTLATLYSPSMTYFYMSACAPCMSLGKDTDRPAILPCSQKRTLVIIKEHHCSS